MRRDSEAEKLAECENRYKGIESFLTEEERDKIARLKEAREAGDRYNAYGHDLFAAVARGHRRRSRELIAAAMERQELAANYGDENGRRHKPSFRFAMALYDLILVAAAQGATAEEIRTTLERDLERTDSGRIERLVERAQEDA